MHTLQPTSSPSTDISLPAGTACSHITIVTPSFNRARFLEATMCSVLDQDYPNLEYIVVDGGSTDGSADIIRKHADRLAWSCCEADGGQYDAINKGFAHGTGEIMGWLNSDDLHFPWALRTVATVFSLFPDVDWITSLLPVTWNAQGVPFSVRTKEGFSSLYFRRGLYMSDPSRYTRGFIQQESTFWRRSLWEKIGGSIDTSFRLAGDFDLWARFFEEADLCGVQAPLAGFRLHGDQVSITQREEYRADADRSLRSHGGKPCGRLEGWLRRHGSTNRWPLRVMPSMGFVQPVRNIRWDGQNHRWTESAEWIG